jgi:hypothetical protein
MPELPTGMTSYGDWLFERSKAVLSINAPTPPPSLAGHVRWRGTALPMADFDHPKILLGKIGLIDRLEKEGT